MRRRILTLMLLGVMSVSIMGCGKTSGDAVSSGAAVSGNTAAVSISANKETEKATVHAPVFQVGSTTLTLGKSTVQDLVTAGASFDTNGSVQSTDFSEDPNYSRQLSFKVGDTDVKIVATNKKNAIRPIKNSVIESVTFNGTGVCGIAGIAVGDTAQDMTKKLGKEFLIENSDDFQTQYDLHGYQNISIPTGSRVYFYSDVLDDCPVLVAVDRNTSAVSYVSESLPAPMITKPSDISSDSVWQSAIANANTNGTFSTNMTARSIWKKDQTVSENTDVTSLYANISNLKFTKLRYLSMNKVKDAAKLYESRQGGLTDNTVATTYMVYEWEGQGKGTVGDTSYDKLYGCFYIPNPALVNRSIVNRLSPTSTTPYVILSPVFTDETDMLSYIVSNDNNKSLGYSISDFTIMDQMISFNPAVDKPAEDSENKQEKDEYATDVQEASSTDSSVSGNSMRESGELKPGTYTFGKDIAPGRYSIALKDGRGYLQFSTNGSDLSKSEKYKITKKDGLEATFSDGDQILVDGYTIELKKA